VWFQEGHPDKIALMLLKFYIVIGHVMFEPGRGQCIMRGTKCIIVANSSCMLITASTAMCLLYVQAWDDVERKARPVDKMSVYSKKTVLDQEKSKLSLSQIYEQQFLKQTQVCVATMLWRGQ